MSGKRTRTRLLALAATLMILAAPSGATLSAPASDDLTHQFELEGPYPIFQEVNFLMRSVSIVDNGDFLSQGEVDFRFRLDVHDDYCWWQDGDPVTDALIVRPAAAGVPWEEAQFVARCLLFGPFCIMGRSGPLASVDECDHYDYVAHRGTYKVTDGERLDSGELDVILPEDSMAEVSRYGGHQVRVSVGATEQDVVEDDYLGGVRTSFSYRSNFGAGDEVLTSGNETFSLQFLEFWTCVNQQDVFAAGGCYRADFRMYTRPKPLPIDQHLEVWQVWGESATCQAGKSFTFGVKMRNPENIMSEQYAVAIARLDGDTNRIENVWNSPALPGMGGPDYQGQPTLVEVNLGPGRHRLAVWATGHANAMEFDITCSFDTRLPNVVLDDDEQETTPLTPPGRVQPTATVTTTPQTRVPDVGPRVQATATATPDLERRPGPRLP